MSNFGRKMSAPRWCTCAALGVIVAFAWGNVAQAEPPATEGASSIRTQDKQPAASVISLQDFSKPVKTQDQQPSPSTLSDSGMTEDGQRTAMGGGPCLSQLPNQANGLFSDVNCAGCGTGTQVIADNFIMDVDGSVDGLRFWGGYFPENIPQNPDCFTVIFYADGGGTTPGTIINQIDCVDATTRVDTGVDLFGVDEYMYTLDLVPNKDLAAGTYWVSIHNNTTASSEWFWETGNLDPVYGILGLGFAFEFPVATWNADGATDVAFEVICKQGTCGADGCEEGENGCTCPEDCPPNFCGDGVCCVGEGEDCDTCPADCGVCPFCGDGNVDPGEDCDPPNSQCTNGQLCTADCQCPGLPNDDCVDRIDIFDGVTPYDTTGATTDGPSHGGCEFDGQTYHDIWYNYTATCNGLLTVTTCEDNGGGAGYDTDLVVYDNCECPATDPPLGCNDDNCSVGFHSFLQVPVLMGNCYKIRVGGWNNGDQGPGQLFVGCEIQTVCGDDICEGNEDCANCALDCGDCVCGDDVCDPNESPCNCPADCPGPCLPDCLIQPPNQSNGIFADTNCAGCGTGVQVLADNFLMLEDGAIDVLRVWGGYFPQNIPEDPDCFTVIFREDAAGTPGPIINQLGPCVQATTRTDTGIDLFGVDEYVYDFDLVPNKTLAAGTYWVEVFNNTTSSDEWFWEVGDLDPDHGIIGLFFAFEFPEVTWNPDAATDLAFELICKSLICDPECEPPAVCIGGSCCGDGVVEGGEQCDPGGCGLCPTDASGDGITNAADLAQLLGAWGPLPPDAPANIVCLDSNGDGIINATDLATLLGAWGPCPIGGGDGQCSDEDCLDNCLCVGRGACCLSDGGCLEAQTADECADAGGSYAGDNSTCDDCPNPGCFGAEGDCCLDHGGPGCNDLDCCALVCAFDEFCCETWDSLCAQIANDLCGCPIPCDNCGEACAISDGLTAFDTSGANTDGVDVPAGQCNDFGETQVNNDIWYNYTATCDGLLLVTTCEDNGGSATYDSDLAMYSAGTGNCDDIPCPPGNDMLVDCNDDECTVGFHSTMADVPVTAGTCYKIRVGGWSAADEGAGQLLVDCVQGTECGDNVCEGDEDSCNCPADCGGPGVCGDGICCAAEGEDCENCVGDCGVCNCGINQPPNQSNGIFSDEQCAGCGTGQQTIADNFVHGGVGTLSSIRWWGGYFPENIPQNPDCFTINIRSDAAGAPGGIFSTLLSCGTADTRVDTGVDLFGVDEYVYDLAIGAVLPAGTWWVEIYNSTTASSEWFWEVGDLDPVGGILGLGFAFEIPAVTWNADGATDVAFVITCE